MAKPVLRAIEDGEPAVDDPTGDALHDLLADMNLRHRFVILERLDPKPHEMTGPEPIARVMINWTHDRQGWREAIPWVPTFC
ncbi:hypothetical protein [Streptomyces brevispora]|uniref:Uncharacterized protein n=1 Tax=Streptomyces brevispora TaxID=887462 RepID=A0ABZ1FWG0_9ACTN|nr:hypothetical protein [Streptomyces brevispora]WSC11933.1 hypothetical protein OIE64_03080 [Streptomyces brevispora]